jgi:hypothetical protein
MPGHVLAVMLAAIAVLVLLLALATSRGSGPAQAPTPHLMPAYPAVATGWPTRK